MGRVGICCQQTNKPTTDLLIDTYRIQVPHLPIKTDAVYIQFLMLGLYLNYHEQSESTSMSTSTSKLQGEERSLGGGGWIDSW